VTKSSTTTGYTDKTRVIGSCNAGNVAVSCTVAKGKTVTNNLSVAFGLSASYVSGQLGYSYSSASSTTVSCSATVPKGKTLKAYPQGTRRVYSIAQTTKHLQLYNNWTKTSTVSGLTSFQSNNGISCWVV
jgi:hypothetical protein